MTTLSFDHRVAVVTGAGRGLGRAYARLLAARGAAVVVNDIGGSVEGEGTDVGPAAAVVAEIEGAGGTAVADSSDVANADEATALIDAALERFGRLDILVNNAGIVRWAGFPEVDAENLAQHLNVHVFGSFHTVRAAWPHLVAQRYGRIVLTTSTGLFGLPTNTSYATAKAALVGMMRSAALAGARHGIAVNCIAPAAYTRMAGPGGAADGGGDDPLATVMAPELVAPLAAYLSHEQCTSNGEVYAAGAGRFARLFIATTPGYVHPHGAATVEDVAEHWETINDPTGYVVPGSLTDWSRSFMAHLPAPD